MLALSATFPAAFSICIDIPTPMPTPAVPDVVWDKTRASVTAEFAALLRIALTMPPLYMAPATPIPPNVANDPDEMDVESTALNTLT